MTIKAKRGEVSIRDTFIEELKNVFENERYEIFEEIIIKDSSGKSIKISDLVVLETGKFSEVEEDGELFIYLQLGSVKTIVETKNPKRYASEGLVQLFKYCDLLNVNNGYTTNFSNAVFYYQEDKPLLVPTKFSGDLRRRCNALARFMLKNLKNPPSKKKINEVSEDLLIETLQIIHEDIKSFIKEVDIEDISDSMGIFKISSDKDIISEVNDEDIKNAASFLLLNQLLFYGILSEKLGLITFIEKIETLDQLKKIFNYIFLINYRAVYGYDIIQFLDNNCVNAINSILAVFRKFNFHELKKDILGKIFHGIIPLNLRKRIAAYYTSNQAGELLARLSIKNNDDKIFDPACGSGTLLVSALNIKNELLNKNNIKRNHQEILKEIFGVDISIFASHLSVINLSIQDLNSTTNQVFIFIDDAFNLMPSMSKIVLFSAKPKQQATKDGVKEAEKIEIPLFDVVISNPPFTRIERLTEDKKNYLEKQANMKEFMIGQAGLHVAFIIHSNNFIKKGGHLAMVLPSATFSSNYSKKIEEFILKNFIIKYIITSDVEIAFSEDANFKEVLLICTKEESQDWVSKFVTLKKPLREYNLTLLTDGIKNINKDHDDDSLNIRMITKKDLSSTRNWTKFTRKGLGEIIEKIYTSKILRPQDRIIKYHEGYHLDAPYFFRIPNRVWEIINDLENFIVIQNKVGTELKIPKSHLVKSLGKPQDHTNPFPIMSSYVVSIENNQINRNLPESDLKTYIEWGKNYSKTTMSPKKKEKKTVLDLYKLQKYIKANRPWYTYGHYILRHKKVNGITRQIGGKIALIEKFGVKTRPNIAYFSVKNLTGSNSFFFGEIIAPKINPIILGAWFCSSIYLLLYLYNRREIGGDYGRIKIKDFHSFKCIDPRKLSKDQMREIINAFKEYRTNFPEDVDIYSQILNRNKQLVSLDKTILSNLNISMENLKIEQILENLYTAIIEELEKFKR